VQILLWFRQVLELSDNIRKQIPENIDYEQTVKIMATDHSPLKTVLLQEVCITELLQQFFSTSSIISSSL
jgi:hypothetical protein